jgi:hypothetical protein
MRRPSPARGTMTSSSSAIPLPAAASNTARAGEDARSIKEPRNRSMFVMLTLDLRRNIGPRAKSSFCRTRPRNHRAIMVLLAALMPRRLVADSSSLGVL